MTGEQLDSNPDDDRSSRQAGQNADSGVRVLVCGSRNWTDTFIIWTLLSGIQARPDAGRKMVVIQGGAKGADRIAWEWAQVSFDNPDSNCMEFTADWDKYGKRAGYLRNARMLNEGKPDLVLAFRSEGESKGTDMMIDIAGAAKVPTYVISAHIDCSGGEK